MASLNPSLRSNSESETRDNAEHPIPSISNSESETRDNAEQPIPSTSNKSFDDQDSPRKKPKTSYPIVQYRRSGQYYRYSTDVDRASQSPPKRYIAADPEKDDVATGAEEEEQEQEDLIRKLTWNEILEIEEAEAEFVNERVSLEECLATDDLSDLQRASLEESLREGPKIEEENQRQIRELRMGILEIALAVNYSVNGDFECDDEGCVCECNTVETSPTIVEARDDESNETNTTTATTTSNKSLVQALRDLYHFGRTPSNDEISSFSTQGSDDTREGVTDTSSNADPEDGTCGASFCDEEDIFCYSGLEATDYYSEDLVVEWENSLEEPTITNIATAGGTAKNTTSYEDVDMGSRKRDHSNAFGA